jgi:cysteine desulfurase/selenocysteine lyase
MTSTAEQNAVRFSSGGHHCMQPLMHRLGVESTARASCYFYNTKAELDRFVEVIKQIQKFFAQ